MKIKFNTFSGSLVVSALALAPVPSALASPATDSATYSPSLVIPDNDLNGVANTETIASSIQSITDVTVSLNISGGYDGDLYAYLAHGATGFAVLLNRTGVTAGSAYGSSDSGFNVTLNDAAATDIHNAPALGGVLTGTFQPDGRAVSPLSSLDTTPRTAFLSSFDGMSATRWLDLVSRRRFAGGHWHAGELDAHCERHHQQGSGFGKHPRVVWFECWSVARLEPPPSAIQGLNLKATIILQSAPATVFC